MFTNTVLKLKLLPVTLLVHAKIVYRNDVTFYYGANISADMYRKF